jgi:hypothetical protein
MKIAEIRDIHCRRDSHVIIRQLLGDREHDDSWDPPNPDAPGCEGQQQFPIA